MGTAERREREKEERRNGIIDAAERVFFQRGIANATIDEIAEKAELSKGTIYLYFRNKEDLYLAVIVRGLAILEEKFVTAGRTQDTGFARVEAIGKAFFEFCRVYPDYFNAMLHFESSDVSGDTESGYAAECYRQSGRTFEVCAQAVQAGIDDGSIREDLDPMKTAMTLYGVSVGLLQTVAKRREMIRRCHNVDPDELIETFFKLIGNALRPSGNEVEGER